MKVNDYFEFDDEHPIPNLDVVDINTVKTNGGSDLFVIVATPLADDPRSLKRLLRKIERYLEFLNSEEFLAQSGPHNSKYQHHCETASRVQQSCIRAR